jgi:hypothetical protein
MRTGPTLARITRVITLTLALGNAGQNNGIVRSTQRALESVQSSQNVYQQTEEVINIRPPCERFRNDWWERLAAPFRLSVREMDFFLRKLPDRRMARRIRQLLEQGYRPCDQQETYPSLPRNCFETVAAILGASLERNSSESDWPDKSYGLPSKGHWDLLPK